MKAIREQWLGVTIASIALFVAAGGPGAAVAAVDDLITGKEIANRTITDRDISKKTLENLQGQSGAQGQPGQAGATGPEGPAGTSGSADTPAQVLAKLATVDGAGSGLDSDLLDGVQASGFVADADSAAGDITGQFSNLQLGSSVVGTAEIATGGVDSPEIALDAVGGSEIEAASVDAEEIVFGAVGVGELSSGGAFSTPSTNPPSIAAGTCATDIITFAGADLGEIALVRPLAALGAGMYMQPAAVAQEDEVAYVYCNGSAVTVNPGVTAFSVTLVS